MVDEDVSMVFGICPWGPPAAPLLCTSANAASWGKCGPPQDALCPYAAAPYCDHVQVCVAVRCFAHRPCASLGNPQSFSVLLTGHLLLRAGPGCMLGAIYCFDLWPDGVWIKIGFKTLPQCYKAQEVWVLHVSELVGSTPTTLWECRSRSPHVVQSFVCRQLCEPRFWLFPSTYQVFSGIK